MSKLTKLEARVMFTVLAENIDEFTDTADDEGCNAETILNKLKAMFGATTSNSEE